MFIPNKMQINIGDRVRLKKDITIARGTFTKGHQFVVIKFTARGPDLIDDDGNQLLEVVDYVDVLEKV